MCQACEEMQLYYAYLDAVEEAKRKAQPWECEVTVIPQGDAAPMAAAPTTGAFVCDSGSDAPLDTGGPLPKPFAKP
jgi:hypothetical protein